VLIGCLNSSLESKFAGKVLTKFYSQLSIDPSKIIEIDSNSSEISKLSANAFLAQRISSINSLTELCELSDGNINNLSMGIGSDSRIGKNYLKASLGFGGSCLKKDTLSLVYIFSEKNLHVQAQYWSQVILMNEYQRLRICSKIFNSIKESYVIILGVSFKGNTNDVRGSSAIFLASYLISRGAKVILYDPYVCEEEFTHELDLYNNGENIQIEEKLIFTNSEEKYKSYLPKSNVLAFGTNHTGFSELNLKDMANEMKSPAYIFDLYDIFTLEKMKETEFQVFKLGMYSDIK
jgi:UDPglucose 6-dehydrogenase